MLCESVLLLLLLSTIPLYDIFDFLHMDRHLDCLQLLAELLCVFVWLSLCENLLSFLLCKYLGVE